MSDENVGRHVFLHGLKERFTSAFYQYWPCEVVHTGIANYTREHFKTLLLHVHRQITENPRERLVI